MDAWKDALRVPRIDVEAVEFALIKCFHPGVHWLY